MPKLTQKQLIALIIGGLIVVFVIGIIFLKSQPTEEPPSPSASPEQVGPALPEPETDQTVPSLTEGTDLPDIEQDLNNLDLGNLEQELNQEVQDMEAQLQQLE